ncbi:hypothetical protein BVRB_4g094700 [Beta vulgaris subsp. vulgaris]|nr:hypothetical protein BVRB_4g094700 [Beta vulgaris subsp. vulgaris]
MKMAYGWPRRSMTPPSTDLDYSGKAGHDTVRVGTSFSLLCINYGILKTY